MFSKRSHLVVAKIRSFDFLIRGIILLAGFCFDMSLIREKSETRNGANKDRRPECNKNLQSLML